MIFVYWILGTVVLSAITEILFTSFAVYIEKTKRKIDSIFWQCFCGGIIGGFLGIILGLILGYIAVSLTPYGDDLLRFGGIGQGIVFMQIFPVCWLICITLGGIIGGNKYLEKR